MPVREYTWDGTSWVGSSNINTRDNLIAGTYVPGLTSNTVGVPNNFAGINSSVAGTVQAKSTGAYQYYTRYIATGGSYSNIRFECPVFLDSSTTADCTFYQCHFVGLNPQTVQSLYDTYGAVNGVSESASGFVNYTTRHATFIDCTFDNGWWYDQGTSDRLSTLWSFGLHGGNFTLTRCELKRYTDGINWAQGPCGTSAYTLLDSCWVHQGFYANNIATPSSGLWAPQSGAYTHSDAFQFNTGRNLEVRYSLVGGTRNDFTTRSDVPYAPGGESGDDYFNSAFMWQQETNNYTTAGLIANVNIHDNWLGGGTGTLQAVTKNGNTMSDTCAVTNNKVLVRSAGWGTAVDSTGYYFVQSSDMGIVYSGNVLWDGTTSNLTGNGTTVPIANW